MHSVVTDAHFILGSVSMTTRKELTAVLGVVLPPLGRSHSLKVLHMWLITAFISPPWVTIRV